MSKSIIHVPRRYVKEEWGGTETVIQAIARHQIAAGFHPKIITSTALSNRMTEEVGGIPVERHHYCYPYFGLSSKDRLMLDKKGGNLLSFTLLRSLLAQKDARIFHAHSLKRMGGTVATAARFLGKPFVVSLHGGVFEVPQTEVDNMRRPVEGKLEWGKPFGALLGSRSLLERADMVICVGENEAKAAQKELNHDRITYLPNGVDTARFHGGNGGSFRRNYGIKDSEFLVLNVGRIDAQKNQLGLVRAFAELVKQVPSARLVLIGPETQQGYLFALRACISENGLNNTVFILPGLPPDSPDLTNAYAACDVFALPSTHEAFGIAALEAWSSEKPVVAAAVGGLKSLVSHGETGLLANSATDLINHLISLQRSRELRQKLAARGRDEARSCYDWSIIQDRLESIYQHAEVSRTGKQKSKATYKVSPSPIHV